MQSSSQSASHSVSPVLLTHEGQLIEQNTAPSRNLWMRSFGSDARKYWYILLFVVFKWTITPAEFQLQFGLLMTGAYLLFKAEYGIRLYVFKKMQRQTFVTTFSIVTTVGQLVIAGTAVYLLWPQIFSSKGTDFYSLVLLIALLGMSGLGLVVHLQGIKKAETE